MRAPRPTKEHGMSEPSASSSATAVRSGALALTWTGKRLPLQVLRSAVGHYIGTKTTKDRYRGSPSSISRPTSQHSAPWIPMPGHSALTPDSHPSRSSLMNLSLPEDVLDQMALEQAHFDAAPQAFFEAWKRGARRSPATSGSATAHAKVCSVPPPSGTCGPTC
jgi:hypothetical protein